nr:hypothetical protein [Nanoarchaeum sp.]
MVIYKKTYITLCFPPDMKYIASLIIILIIVSSVAAGQLESLDSNRAIRIKNISNLNLSDVNITYNITHINLTNITEINITEVNITDNLTEINITENITLPNITENITNSSFANITGDIIYIPIIGNLSDNLTLEEPIQTVVSTSPTTTYYYAGSKLIATKNNDNINYQYQDRLGSDVESNTLPFGEEINSNERFSFTGKELDEELYYFNARYYDAKLGRFTSIDPVPTEPAYQYVQNNPVNNNDPDGRQTNPANLDSLITYTLSDTLQVARSPRNIPTGSTVIIDYANLKGPITAGVTAFQSALSNGLSFGEAVAKADSVSWKATPFDTARTTSASRDSLETATYDNPKGLPALSSFFDGSCPDAVCREYVALTTATLNIIAEQNPELFKGKEITILNIYGERISHQFNAQGTEDTTRTPVGHAVISIKDSTGTSYITWGRYYTQKELETIYNKGTLADPVWYTGGYNFKDKYTWKNKLKF